MPAFYRQWPKHYPKYQNGNTQCDAKFGYCSCGAHHAPGEFKFIHGTLYRFGTPVGGKEKPMDYKELEARTNIRIAMIICTMVVVVAGIIGAVCVHHDHWNHQIKLQEQQAEYQKWVAQTLDN